MKFNLNNKDLVQNIDQLNEFLNKKGMSTIIGGQSAVDNAEEVAEYGYDKSTTLRPYPNTIYSNYCESTYVNRI